MAGKAPLVQYAPIARNVFSFGLFIRWTLALVLLALSLPALADRYVFQNYSIEDGLPDLGVTDVVQDGKGYMWVATESGGVARFDGRQFQIFSAAQGLPSLAVRCLAVTKDGTLWAGCKAGAAWFDGRGFKPGKGMGALEGTDVRDILEDSKGRLWFATFNGLFSFEGGRLKAYESFFGQVRTGRKGWEDKVCSRLIQKLAEDREGNIWIGTSDGLSRFSEGRFWNAYFAPGSGEMKHSYISCLLMDGRGTLWLGSDAGVEFFKDGRFEAFDLGTGKKTYVLDFMEDREGRVWIATMGHGVFRYDGRDLKRFGPAEGLAARDFWKIYWGRWGNVWLGSMDSGLWMFQGESFSFVDAGGRIPQVSVTAVTRDPSGGLYIGTWGLGLCRYKGGRLDWFTTKEGLPSDFIHGLCPASSGGVWVATNSGLAILLGDRATLLPSEPFGVSFAQIVRQVWEDPQGIMWAVTFERGLLRWDGRRLVAFPQVYPHEFVYTRSLFADHGGRLWLGTMGGLYEFSGSELRFHRVGQVPQSDFVLQIAEDRESRLWVLTPHKLLISRPSSSSLPLSFDEVPLEYPVNEGALASFTFDEAGSAWIGGMGCLLRISLEGPGRSPSVRRFGAEDGFPPVACQERAAYADPAGGLFFGTSQGLLHFDPEALPRSSRRPLVYLTALRLSFKDTDWNVGRKGLPYASLPAAGATLAHGQNHLTFDFDGLVFPRSRQLVFQSRLDGLDAEWSPPSSATSATYPKLPPGQYTFRVKGGIPGKEWAEAVPLNFSIRAPFWGTAWFVSICLSLAVLTVLAVIHLRTRLLLERRVELEDIVAKRTSELQEARDGLERKVAERTRDLVSARGALEEQLDKTQTAHRALEASEERFRSLYQNALVGIFRAEPDGRLLLANPALLSILGAKDEKDLEGMSLCCERCIEGSARGSCSHSLRVTDSPGIFEADWTRLDGEPVLAKIHARLVPGHGDGERFIEGSVEDVTAVRKAGFRLRFLETAIEAMDLGLTITDSANRILYANESQAKMHGLTVEGMIGRDVQDFAPETLRHQTESKNGPARWVYRRESSRRRRDGKLFPVYLTSVPIAGKAGIPLGLITFCEDMTEAKKRDMQLQEALRDAVVGKLAAVVAHQVNTPLAAMKTRLELLKDDTEGNEEARRGIEIVMKQVDKVAQTVRSLLGFVRQRSVAEGVVSLQEIVSSVAHLYETVFQSKGVSLDVAIPETNLMVQGSAADLQEIFLNLFENHREALGRGHHVRVSAQSRSGMVEIVVEDDGEGLGADPEKVFEPFYTTKATGTGLGLSICRNVCAACGGTIRGENRAAAEGGGARFVITLPLASPEDAKGMAP